MRPAVGVSAGDTSGDTVTGCRKAGSTPTVKKGCPGRRGKVPAGLASQGAVASPRGLLGLFWRRRRVWLSLSRLPAHRRCYGGPMTDFSKQPGSVLIGMLVKNYGLAPETLQSIGALFVMCAAFEIDLEMAIWRLSGETPFGKIPSTDKMPAANRIIAFRKHGLTHPGKEWTEIINGLADTADYVTQYRNAIGHGRLLPAQVGGGTILNWARHGELRKRDPVIAHLDERLVGLMLEALHELLIDVDLIAKGDGEPHLNPRLLARLASIRRARSAAAEVRHLAEYMHHEQN